MSITQTVEIPESHLLTVKVPREVPSGRTVLIFRPAAEESVDSGMGLGADPRFDPAEAVKRCSGIFNRLGIGFSSDDFLALRRKDKELEDRLDSREI